MISVDAHTDIGEITRALSMLGGKIKWSGPARKRGETIHLETVQVDEQHAASGLAGKGWMFADDDIPAAIDAAGLAEFVAAVARHDVMTAQALAARLFEHDSEVFAIDTALRQLLSPGCAHRSAA